MADQYNCPKCGQVIRRGIPQCSSCGAKFNWRKKTTPDRQEISPKKTTPPPIPKQQIPPRLPLKSDSIPGENNPLTSSQKRRLTNCQDCNAKISTRALACPHCGAPTESTPYFTPKSQKKDDHPGGCLTAVIVLMLLIVGWMFISSKLDDTPKTAEAIREEQIGRYFSSWDGSHDGLTAYIKRTMNDPSSYEHVDTVYRDHDDYLIVTTKFRGKNAFGGTVTNSICAKVDLQGEVLEILYYHH